MGKPVVATSIACSGLEVAEGRTFLSPTRRAAFSARTVNVLSDGAPRARLAPAARKTACEGYAWGHLGERLARMLEESGRAHPGGQPQAR